MLSWNSETTIWLWTWSTVSHGSFSWRLKHVFCFHSNQDFKHLVGIYNVVRGVHQLGGPQSIYSKHTICSDVSRCCLQRWPPLLGPQCVGEAEGRSLARHSGWATSWIRGWRFTSCLDNLMFSWKSHCIPGVVITLNQNDSLLHLVKKDHEFNLMGPPWSHHPRQALMRRNAETHYLDLMTSPVLLPTGAARTCYAVTPSSTQTHPYVP